MIIDDKEWREFQLGTKQANENSIPFNALRTWHWDHDGVSMWLLEEDYRGRLWMFMPDAKTGRFTYTFCYLLFGDKDFP